MSLLSCVVSIVLAYQGRRSECHGQNDNECNATDFHVTGFSVLGLVGGCFVVRFWVIAFRHRHFISRLHTRIALEYFIDSRLTAKNEGTGFDPSKSMRASEHT